MSVADFYHRTNSNIEAKKSRTECRPVCCNNICAYRLAHWHYLSQHGPGNALGGIPDSGRHWFCCSVYFDNTRLVGNKGTRTQLRRRSSRDAVGGRSNGCNDRPGDNNLLRFYGWRYLYTVVVVQLPKGFSKRTGRHLISIKPRSLSSRPDKHYQTVGEHVFCKAEILQ